MRRLFLLLDIFIVSQIAWAQCKLTVTVSFSGNCGGSLDARLQKAVSEQMAQHWNGMTFNSSTDCERAGLAARNDISGSYGGCTAHVTVLCGGCLKSSKAGNANMSGVGQGTSYYSTNVANEIQNWSEDDMERMLALNPEYANTSPAEISMGNTEVDIARNNARENAFVLDTSKPFVSINMREGGSSMVVSEDLSMRDGFSKVEMSNDFSHLANRENVEKYVNYCRNLSDLFIDLDNPFYGDITMLLHQKFKEATEAAGQAFDLEIIMLKLPSERTEAEKQALIDYQEFRKRVTEDVIKDIENYVANLPETKDFEMAALAEDCYKDSEHAFLSRTNYKKVQTDFFEEGSQMYGLSELINDCNATHFKTGFHADLYYNEKTKEYTIAFEGTNVDEEADLKADYELGTGEVPDPYRLANKIANYLNSSDFPSNININITGHSLGGGEASIVGMLTGKPTYTFNAAGLNNNVIKEFGLNGKPTENIRAFQDKTSLFKGDPLTEVQEGVVGKIVAIGVASAVSTTLISNTEVDGLRVPGSNNSQLYNEGMRLQKEMLKGNIAAPTIGNKIKVEFGGGHSIKPMTHGLMEQCVNAALPYNHLKNKLYEKGHGVEYQTQETILIYTGL